jgi:hypothetical protein
LKSLSANPVNHVNPVQKYPLPFLTFFTSKIRPHNFSMKSYHLSKLALTFVLGFYPALTHAQLGQPADLARLTPGQTKAVNALWIENPLSLQFKTTKRVVVADLKGPAEITMIHFAYPQNGTVNRDLLLRIYWDGETNPSVECPMVDFFCDPNGSREVVNTALVNVRHGYNAYFPMPFRKSARIELEYQGPVAPGDKLWSLMPCYSYVCYRTLTDVPANTGYFCASWRQETLKLVRDYVALEATGKGKFIGWNVTVRRPGTDYPVDENEKFYVDGESTASVEFQGLEDSFGFSWGFPNSESMFPLTGYFPFMNGAAAYRFFLQDSISFEKSLKVAIGFGVTEKWFKDGFSRFGTSLQLSSTVYWYQTEPHAPLPPLPSVADREPAPNKLYWPEEAETPNPEELQKLGIKMKIFCGHPEWETDYAAPGYAISNVKGEPSNGNWGGDVSYCLCDPKELDLTLNLPKGVKGVLRLYIIDPDDYMGGRKETIVVGGDTVGTFDHFQQGRWVEVPVAPEKTADGKLRVQILNGNRPSNAVVSKLEWIEK